MLHPRRPPEGRSHRPGLHLNSLLPAVLIGIPISVLVAGLQRVTRSLRRGGRWPAACREVFLGLVVSEIGSYWGHRWSHHTPFLWRFHSLHHAPEQIDWLVNTRAHPLDMVFTRLCGLVPLYVLGLASVSATGAAALVPTFVLFFGTVWGFFVHANVRWRFGPLEQLISTPHFHTAPHQRREPRPQLRHCSRGSTGCSAPITAQAAAGLRRRHPPPADFAGALLLPSHHRPGGRRWLPSRQGRLTVGRRAPAQPRLARTIVAASVPTLTLTAVRDPPAGRPTSWRPAGGSDTRTAFVPA